MAFTAEFAQIEPRREDIDAASQPLVLEFGVDWCPHCQRAQPLIAAVLNAHPALRHIKVEDGSGRPLGRSFRVKLWPTLIFLKDGKEIARVVRPADAAEVERAVDQLLTA